MGKLTWKQFVEFWSRGLKPSEAAEDYLRHMVYKKLHSLLRKYLERS